MPATAERGIDYQLGKLGWTGWASLVSQQSGRSLAGRLDRGRLTAMLLGPRMTRWGPVKHPAHPILSASLVATANGTDLIGQLAYARHVRFFLWLWFCGVLAFLVLGVAIMLFDPSQRRTGAGFVLATTVMLGFGLAFATTAAR